MEGEALSILDAFEPDRNPGSTAPKGDLAQLRVVPFQPEGTPVGYVFLGAELGHVFFAGERPRPGDLVAVVGQLGSYVAFLRRTVRERDPLFADTCRCRCPAAATSGGMIAYVTKIETTSILLVVDGATGAVLHYSRLPEIFSAEGVAIDPEPPHDMYIIDNRGGSSNLNADGIPPQDPTKQWLFMLKYVISGNVYQFSAIEILPGAFADVVGTDGYNTLTVLDGVCHITLNKEPARFLKWSGSGFTTVTLTLDNTSYDALLLGNIARVADRPAVRTQLYCLAIADPGSTNVFQLLRFTPEGVIVGVLESEEFVDSQQVLAVCNRLYVFQSFGPFRGG